MTFDELCAFAGNGKPLPRSALPLERVAYRGLAWLYHAYRRGAFSKDEAAEEKEALRREYEDARKKEKDDLKLHQSSTKSVQRWQAGLRRWSRAAALYAGGLLRFWTGGI